MYDCIHCKWLHMHYSATILPQALLNLAVQWKQCYTFHCRHKDMGDWLLPGSAFLMFEEMPGITSHGAELVGGWGGLCAEGFGWRWNSLSCWMDSLGSNMICLRLYWIRHKCFGKQMLWEESLVCCLWVQCATNDTFTVVYVYIQTLLLLYICTRGLHCFCGRFTTVIMQIR